MRHSTGRLLVTVAVAAGLLLVLGWLADHAEAVCAEQGILYVALDGDDSAGCDSIVNRCRTIQRAVDVAQPGDEIRVAGGLYTGVSARGGITQAVYVSKTITLLGGYSTADWTASDPAAHPTTIDAQGLGRGLSISGRIEPVICGLRITGGDATGLGGGLFGYDVGGGVYIDSASATITGSLIFSNHAPDRGGGVYVRNSDAVLQANTILSNTSHDGGGVAGYHCSGTLRQNRIAFNEAGFGGGLYLLRGDTTVEGNTIALNSATYVGGGVQLLYGSHTLDGNVVVGNSSMGTAGAVDLFEGEFKLVNNAIIDNHAGESAPGIWVRRGSTCMLHSTVARNCGGDGTGIYVADWKDTYSTLALTNTIVVSHEVGIHITDGNTVTVQSVLWDHATPVTMSYTSASRVSVQDQHSGDAAFDTDGYHLTLRSAAMGMGVDTDVMWDIDGDPRPEPAGSPPDLGADEIGLPLVYLPLILRGG